MRSQCILAKMIRIWWAWLLAAPLLAHTVSMSTGELTVDGRRATYKLRVPAYETQHVSNPEQALLKAISFTGAKMTGSKCLAGDGLFVCDAVFEFDAEPAEVEASCRLFEVTVPNHVHMLHARRGDQIDQAVFDAAITSARLNFRQVGPIESVLRTHPAAAAVFLLVCVTIGAISRSWKEFARISLTFGAGAIGALIVAWPLTPSFLEAAIALTAAYGAIDSLVAPAAGQRWIAGLLLGIAFGMYLSALFVRAGTAWPVGVYAVALAAIICVALLRIPPAARFIQASVVVVGGIWFAAIVWA